MLGRMRRTVHSIVKFVYLVGRPVCGMALSCKGRTCLIVLFGRNLRIRCFNFFDVCTYVGIDDGTSIPEFHVFTKDIHYISLYSTFTEGEKSQ